MNPRSKRILKETERNRCNAYYIPLRKNVSTSRIAFEVNSVDVLTFFDMRELFCLIKRAFQLSIN